MRLESFGAARLRRTWKAIETADRPLVGLQCALNPDDCAFTDFFSAARSARITDPRLWALKPKKKKKNDRSRHMAGSPVFQSQGLETKAIERAIEQTGRIEEAT